jgi:hypothetical protein
MAKDRIEIPEPINKAPVNNTEQEHPKTEIETTPKKLGRQQQKPSQSSRFEPAAIPVELPSHGFLYKGMKADADIKKGIINVRPLTLREEKILTTQRLVQQGRALDMILENCIKSDVDPMNLLSSDRMYILFYLRGMSYGLEYDFNVRCYRCGADFTQKINIDKLPIKEWKTQEEAEEPWEMVLPVSGCKVVSHYMRGYEENALVEQTQEIKSFEEADDDIGISMGMLIEEVYDADGNKLSEQDKIDFIENMIAGDTGAWREENNERDCGIKTLKNIKCPRCTSTLEFNVPLDRNFFRSQRRVGK